jgi:hypothetical protein
VDGDLWLKLDNGSLAWEIVSVSLFHLGGHLLCPNLTLSCCHRPRKNGTTGGWHKGNVLFPAILNTFHPGASHSALNFGNGHGPFSNEKKGLKAQRLMQLLYIYAML